MESEDPPTVTELARRGTKEKPKPLVDLKGRDPEDYEHSTEGLGVVRPKAKQAKASKKTVAKTS